MNAAMVRVSKQATRHRRTKHADTHLPSHLNFLSLFVFNCKIEKKTTLLMAIISYSPSQADVHVYTTLKSAPPPQYPHSQRWYKHIASYAKEHGSLPGSSTPGQKFTRAAAAASKKEAADEEDIDLFGEDEEEDAETERIKAERVKAYEAKKANKPKTIAKVSHLLLARRSIPERLLVGCHFRS
jgi:hypothetical protein